MNSPAKGKRPATSSSSEDDSEVSSCRIWPSSRMCSFNSNSPCLPCCFRACAEVLVVVCLRDLVAGPRYRDRFVVGLLLLYIEFITAFPCSSACLVVVTALIIWLKWLCVCVVRCCSTGM